MEQYTDSQYDDDLTIGTDEYDDSFQTNDVDLFEFGGDEDSAISRLKTLVLSIDWEITDEVLIQFNDEILDLKDVWAGEKIQMVYLQALEKIGKYIYREKADSHPNAIRLLLSMYYNLERIVLSDELSDAEKKKILFEDVRRFEKLKKLINKGPKAIEPVAAEPVIAVKPDDEVDLLRQLKAIVLGIDWEITDNDLLALREEVERLEQMFSDSKPKLVFLQGIGTLGAYIRKKKSNAHADAFKLLHSFYEGFEKLFKTPGITFEQEKEILRPEVQKFNAFKVIIADTLSGRDVDSGEFEDDEDMEFSGSGSIAPAFSDLPEDGTHGFQEDSEAKALKLDSTVNVDEQINKFFGEDEAQKPAVEPEPVTVVASVEKEAEAFSAAFFDIDVKQEPAPIEVDREKALLGVDVETEADDESGEEALPVFGGEIAPALVDSGDVSAFNAVDLKEAAPAGELTEELTGRLDDFFGITEESEKPEETIAPAFDISADVALQGVNVETEDDEEEPAVTARVDDGGAFDSDIIAPAFAEIEEEILQHEESLSIAEQPAGSAWDETSEEAFAEIPAALFDEASVEEESTEDIAEAAVDLRFDELFALPEEDQEAPELQESEVEETLEGFFTLDEEPRDLDAAVAFTEVEDVDQEFLEIDETDLFAITPELEEKEEEEVVFELAEEIAEPAEEVVSELEESFEIEQELPAEFAVPMDEVVEEPVAAAELVADDFTTQIEPMVDLRGCVQSLGLELNDAIIQGLFTEINSLRQRWADRPVQKTFLQLMSTVAQHIDQYRYGAHDESSALLASIMDDLEKSQTMESSEIQDVLLADTCKVLQWQQEMLDSRAVRGEDGYLTFADVSKAQEVVSFEEPMIEQEEVEELGTALLEEEATFDLDLEEALNREIEEEAQKSMLVSTDIASISDAVRREIDVLRDTLKREIAELRKAMNIENEE